MLRNVILILAAMAAFGATAIAPTSAPARGFRKHIHQRGYHRYRMHRWRGDRRADPRSYYLPHCRILHSTPGGYSAVVCQGVVDKYGRRL